MLKRIAILLATMLMIGTVAYAIGPDPDGRTPTNVYLQAPDGGTVRAQATASGLQRTVIESGTVTATAPDGGLPVTGSVSVTATTGAAFGAVQCDNSTPTLIGGLAGRRAISIQNLGPNAIYLCTASDGCTTATGTKLLNGDPPLSLDVSDAVPLYCLAATAAQVAGADTRYLEVK